MKRMLSIICIGVSTSLALTPCVLTQTEVTTNDQPRKFEGLQTKAFKAPDGRTIPVFITVPSPEFRLESRTDFSQDELLKLLASDGLELRKVTEGPRAVYQSKMFVSITLDDKEVDKLILITVHPQKKGSGRKKIFKKPVTFSPGSLKHFNEAIKKFGQPVEKELWSSKATKDIGLDGLVYWWGGVGAAISKDITFTHILIRQEIDRE
jgi:hypothetical protein